MCRGKAFRRALAPVILLCSSVTFAADVIDDLGMVGMVEGAGLSDEAKSLLKKNGFVVVPDPYHQIFSPYVEAHGHRHFPAFVTTVASPDLSCHSRRADKGR